MTEFIGGVKMLIVEKNDELAARWDCAIKQFPQATTLRVRTAEEAVDTIENSIVGDIRAVCICGNVYGTVQALHALRTVVAERNRESTQE